MKSAIVINSCGYRTKFNPTFERGDSETKSFAAHSNSALQDGGITLAFAAVVTPEAVEEARRILDSLVSPTPFLTGKDLVVVQARSFVAESYPTQPAKANGDKACSGYHFTLLQGALQQLDNERNKSN